MRKTGPMMKKSSALGGIPPGEGSAFSDDETESVVSAINEYSVKVSLKDEEMDPLLSILSDNPEKSSTPSLLLPKFLVSPNENYKKESREDKNQGSSSGYMDIGLPNDSRAAVLEELPEIDSAGSSERSSKFISTPFTFRPTKEQIEDSKTKDGKLKRQFHALQSFYQNLNALHKFKLKYGQDADVPQKCGQLGNWVNKIRQQKKKYDNREQSSLDELKIRQLEQAGFLWGKQRGEKLWLERYQQFCHHVGVFGPLVNTRKSGDVLGRWVSTQRSEFKRFKSGKKSTLTPERVHLLTKAGFVWSAQHSRKSRST